MNRNLQILIIELILIISMIVIIVIHSPCVIKFIKLVLQITNIEEGNSDVFIFYFVFKFQFFFYFVQNTGKAHNISIRPFLQKSQSIDSHITNTDEGKSHVFIFILSLEFRSFLFWFLF